MSGACDSCQTSCQIAARRPSSVLSADLTFIHIFYKRYFPGARNGEVGNGIARGLGGEPTQIFIAIERKVWHKKAIVKTQCSRGVSFRDDFTRQVYLMEENLLPAKSLYVLKILTLLHNQQRRPKNESTPT
jgi:hypothetical protein